MLEKIKRIFGIGDEVDLLKKELDVLRCDIEELKKKRISDRTMKEDPVTPAQVFNEYLREVEDDE